MLLQTIPPKEKALQIAHGYVGHRTKTLGRGNDCCDFYLKLKL